MSERPANIPGIQVLRAAAAVLVVVGHAYAYVEAQLPRRLRDLPGHEMLPWGSGVDLFFVISGFIIAHVSQRHFGSRSGVAPFAVRRILRIYPLYILLSALYLLTLAAAHALPTLPNIIASFLLIPVDSLGNGRIGPFFGLGWTLEYEIFFYLLFACALPLGRGWGLALIAAALLALVAAGTLYRGDIPPLVYWTRPILAEFAIGVGLAVLYSRGLRIGWVGMAGLVAAGILALVAFHVLHLGPTDPRPLGWTRLITWGLPMATVMAGVCLGPEPAKGWPRPLVHLGDASYSLYLIHPFACLGVAEAARAMGLVRSAPLAFVALGIVAAIPLALLSYRFLERPMYQGGVRLADRLMRKPVTAA